MTSWELERHWQIVRYLVYYLVEDLLPPDLIPGKDVVDFSSGLGDLSEYIYAHSPKSLISTSPDEVPPPGSLVGKPGFQFIPSLPARAIGGAFAPDSLDLFVARMVFQFPTADDRIDVDGMLAQIYAILRPGGRLIICSHEFTQLDDHPGDWDLPLDQYIEKLPAEHEGRHAGRIEGLIELIETIGLPPREGVHGQTGFGLKGLMAVDSFVQAGFVIESAAEIEDFTFPVGISRDLETRKDYYRELGQRVFSAKRSFIQSPAFADKYSRPTVLKHILQAINQMHPFVTVPIFKIRAVKP
jgi:SAM-dependent methyltransferase